jgi:hypothetical protein
MKHSLLPPLAVIALFLNASLTLGQAPGEKTTDDRRSTAVTKLCRDDTTGYSLAFADAPAGKFVPKEVMKWANPVRDDQIGVVSIWLKDGRAQALSTVFGSSWKTGEIAVTHEFQSLATRTIVASSKGKTQWSPQQPGITFHPIPDAPVPADTPVARLRQMRNVTRDFSAHSISVHGVETRWELRMLPQPLYRYEGDGRETLDGALFTFVSTAGTDPELLVLIEARKSKDAWAWHFAPARFSDHSLYLRFRDQEVWMFFNRDRSSFFAAGVNDSYRLFQDRVVPEAGLYREAAP